MIGFSEELVILLQDFWFLIEDQVPSGTYPGPSGGTFTATVQDQLPAGELSAGDRVVLQFSDFGFDPMDPDFRVDGSFTYVVNSATVALPVEEYVIIYTLSGLSISGDSLDLLYSGSIKATDTTADQINFTTAVEIASLRSTVDVTGVGTFEQEVRNATLTQESNDIDDDWTAWIEGEFYDSGVGGVMTLETMVAFEGHGDSGPDTGVLEIHGAGNSLVRLTAIDETNVRLEVDEDGDGVIDETSVTTWDAIGPG